MLYTDEGVMMNHKHFDGSTDIYTPYASTTCFKAYQANADYQGDGVNEDSDASQDNMSTSTKPDTPLTRQQQKALDKELPWRVIVDKGGDYLAAFIKAAQDEEKSWMTFKSVDPIDPKTAQEIMASVRSIQQYITRENTHWIPTQLMWADGLTKYSVKLMNVLHAWLQHPYVLLRDQAQKDTSV